MDMMTQNAPQETNFPGPRPHQLEEFQRQLTKKLKEMVNQAVAELKQECQVQTETQTTDEVLDATPISFRVPEENDQPKQRNKAKLVAEIRRSFRLPEEYFAGYAVDLDKLPVPADLLEQMRPKAEYVRLFTFSQRLDRWKILRKQRVNGKFDTYFEHEISDEFFRSIVEVANFMLYAICPRHLQKIPKGTPKEDSSGSKSRKRSRSTFTISNGGHDLEEENSAPVMVNVPDAKAVRDFLEAAYNDLINLHPRENFAQSSKENNQHDDDAVLLSSDSEKSEKLEEDTEILSESKKNHEPKEDSAIFSDLKNNENFQQDAGMLLSGAPKEDILVEDSMAREFDDLLACFVNQMTTQETSVSAIADENGKAKAPLGDPVPAADVKVHNNILPVPDPGEGEGALAAATLGSFVDLFDPLDQLETLQEPCYNPQDYDLAKSLVRLRKNGD